MNNEAAHRTEETVALGAAAEAIGAAPAQQDPARHRRPGVWQRRQGEEAARAAAERVTAERAAAERAREAEAAARERLEAEGRAAEQVALAARAAEERAAAERAATEQFDLAQRASAERIAAERAATERLVEAAAVEEAAGTGAGSERTSLLRSTLLALQLLLVVLTVCTGYLAYLERSPVTIGAGIGLAVLYYILFGVPRASDSGRDPSRP